HQVAEQQHRQKRQQDDQQKLISQGRTEFVNGFEIAQYAADNEISSYPEQDGKEREREAATPGSATAEKSIFPGQIEGRKQKRNRAHEIGSGPTLSGACSRVNSINTLPNVRLALLVCRWISAVKPQAISRPFWMIPIL